MKESSLKATISHLRKKSFFTLIELLVVIAIIATKWCHSMEQYINQAFMI